jgi:hypothetical protein
MSDNYLWDKSGEPDPLIEELERELSTLRYQPRPLTIPVPPRFNRLRSFAPTLALAATIVIALLAIGIWTTLKNGNVDRGNQESATDFPPKTDKPAISFPNEVKQDDSVKESSPLQDEQRSELKNTTVASKKRPVRNRQADLFRARQRQEAEIAKDRLLTALRLASTKLNLAQKRAQGTPSVIRNQHKVG